MTAGRRRGSIPCATRRLRRIATSHSQELLTAILDIDDRDQVVWGIVHSHVASKAEPSATDVGLAQYPDALYLICSLASDPPIVRAWSIVEGGVSEVVLHRT